MAVSQTGLGECRQELEAYSSDRTARETVITQGENEIAQMKVILETVRSQLAVRPSAEDYSSMKTMMEARPTREEYEELESEKASFVSSLAAIVTERDSLRVSVGRLESGGLDHDQAIKDIQAERDQLRNRVDEMAVQAQMSAGSSTRIESLMNEIKEMRVQLGEARLDRDTESRASLADKLKSDQEIIRLSSELRFAKERTNALLKASKGPVTPH